MDEEEAPRGHGKSMLVMALGAALLLGAVWLLVPMPLDCTFVMRLFVSNRVTSTWVLFHPHRRVPQKWLIGGGDFEHWRSPFYGNTCSLREILHGIGGPPPPSLYGRGDVVQLKFFETT